MDSFGKRLAKLRKEAGYSQRALAQSLGISHRRVAYYEAETNRPPSEILPNIANLLGVSTDELLGIKSTKNKKVNRKLLNKVEKIEALPRRQQKAIEDYIDALLDKHAK